MKNQKLYQIMEAMGNLATEEDALLVLQFIDRHNLNEKECDLFEIYSQAVVENLDNSN